MAERKTIQKGSRPSGNSKNTKKKSVGKNKTVSPSPKKKTTRTPMNPTLKGTIIGIVLLCVGVLLALSLYSPIEENLCGIAGKGLHIFFCLLFGAGAMILPFYLLIMGGHFVWKKEIPTAPYVWGGVFLFLLSSTIHLFAYHHDAVSGQGFYSTARQALDMGIEGKGGGLFGYLISMALHKFIGFWGAAIVLFAVLITAFLLATRMQPLYWAKAGFCYLSAWYHEKREAALLAEEEEDEEEEVIIRGEEKNPRKKKEEEEETPPSVSLTAEDIDDLNRELDEIKIHTPAQIEEYEDSQLGMSEALGEEGIPLEDEPSDDEEEKEDNSAIPVEIEPETEEIPYTFPPIDLLQKPSGAGNAINGDDLRESAKKLVSALHSFGVEAKVLEVVKGPTVTRFELQPAEGVRVNRITTLADDIAMTLAATSVRIEAPIPGKSAVGIEIPNKDVSSVLLREVLQSKDFQDHSSKIAIGLGKDIEGNVIIQDMSKLTHLLIAGSTGSGKSVCVNSIICSILYKADPNEVKLLMVDPKVVELEVYNGIPHLLIPVVTDPRRAAGALNWAVQEMERRYGEFAHHHVRNIKGYNQEMEASGGRKMEQIVIIIDELADLMTVASKEVETAIQRLAQKARAAGMHLIIATQRPSVNVITGVIKANIPSRISFAVASGIDSRTILDSQGAEKLLGKGDMLLLPAGDSKPTRIQGCFVSDKEVENIVEFVKTETESLYTQDIIDQMNRSDQACDAPDPGDADELLPQAIEIVIEAGQASTSMVQRKLKVGYSRAGRLIDQMEERGIVGPAAGSKPREVLITMQDFHEMCMNEDYNAD